MYGTLNTYQHTQMLFSTSNELYTIVNKTSLPWNQHQLRRPSHVSGLPRNSRPANDKANKKELIKSTLCFPNLKLLLYPHYPPPKKSMKKVQQSKPTKAISFLRQLSISKSSTRPRGDPTDVQMQQGVVRVMGADLSAVSTLPEVGSPLDSRFLFSWDLRPSTLTSLC